MLAYNLNTLSFDAILFIFTVILVLIAVKKKFQWDWLTSIVITILSFFINLYVYIPFLVIPVVIEKIIQQSEIIYKIWQPILPVFISLAVIYGILAGAASHFITFKTICYFSKNSYPLVDMQLFKALLIAYGIPMLISFVYRAIVVLNLYFKIT